MEIDRELFLQLVHAISDEVSTLDCQWMFERQEMREKMRLLEMMLFDQNPNDPVEQRIKESWVGAESSTKKFQDDAQQRYNDASRRVAELTMLLEGKSLAEVDRHFKEQDKRFATRRREIRHGFDKIIGRR